MMKPKPPNRTVSPRAQAFRFSLGCPPKDPFYILAKSLITEALEDSYTQREAAKKLGISEVLLSILLKDFPELRLKTKL